MFEYSLPPIERYVGPVVIGSPSSSNRNMGSFRPLFFFWNIVVPWLMKIFFQMRQLIRLKNETLNEWCVKIWRVLLWRLSRVFGFRWIKGFARVTAVKLKGPMFDCNYFIHEFYGNINTLVLSGHQSPRVTTLMKLKRHFTLMSISSLFVMRRANQRKEW